MRRGSRRRSLPSRSVEDLLGRILSIAAHSTGARYAAIGVIGGRGSQRLSTFITFGLTEHEKAQMDSPPAGRGMLGVLIDTPAPVRVSDMSADPRSHGLPPGHPPMRTLLGVPIRANGAAFGSLYLTEKEGGVDFTDQDEAIAVALAAVAGVAVENARLHEFSVQRERWLSATTEMMFALLAETDCEESLRIVADHASRAADADFAWLVNCGGEGARQVKPVSGDGSPALIEAQTLQPLIDAAESGRGGVEFDIEGVGRALFFPLRRSDPRCALILAWPPGRGHAADEVEMDLLGELVEQANDTMELAHGMELRERSAVLRERDRISRDLHDFVIQRLFAVGLELKRSLRLIRDADVSHRFDRVVAELDETIREIRRTVFDLGTTATSDDVQSEITRIVARAESSLKFRPTLAFEGPIRLRVSGELVPDVLAVLGEALANVSRHARAHAVDVLVQVVGDELILRVSDDGVGIPERPPQSGLANLAARATDRGGEFSFKSKAPSGTVLEWRVPLV